VARALHDAEALRLPGPADRAAGKALRRRVEEMRAASDRAFVLQLTNASLALAQRLRGFTGFLEDLLLWPEFATALQERITDTICAQAAWALDEVGDIVDCVSWADDLGFQTSPYMSVELYRSMVKPHHRRFVECIRSRTRAKVIMHSDGAIADLLPDLIDIGVQVINPVQVSAAGMDPGRLKREFGADLCFWGGMDTHHVLPFGSPSEVADFMRRRMDDLGRGGGWVLASVHNIQADVPPENIAAMFDAALGRG
jgi:uroporphyrinogen decarboxylase